MKLVLVLLVLSCVVAAVYSRPNPPGQEDLGQGIETNPEDALRSLNALLKVDSETHPLDAEQGESQHGVRNKRLNFYACLVCYGNGAYGGRFNKRRYRYGRRNFGFYG